MSQIVLLKRQNFIFWQSWRQGVLHPGTSRAGFFWGLIPWLADGYLHAGPSHGLFSGHAHSRCLFFLLRIFVVCCSLPNYVQFFAKHRLQHARLPCPSSSPRVCPSSCLLNQWCHPTISSSITLFCLQSFPASGFFPVSQLFSSGCQSIRVSASASVLPMSIQGWFPLRLTGLISLLSTGLSRIFSSTTVQKHQFFGALPSLGSSPHIRTWLLERL